MLEMVGEVKLKVQRSHCRVSAPYNEQHCRSWMPAVSSKAIHALNSGLLSTYYVPGSILDCSSKVDIEMVPTELTGW